MHVDRTNRRHERSSTRLVYRCQPARFYGNTLPMSRWISNQDVITMPLGKIDEEISAIEARPLAERTVLDAERLADLRAARRQITSHRGRACY